jgi:hypothetical protein
LLAVTWPLATSMGCRLARKYASYLVHNYCLQTGSPFRVVYTIHPTL